MEERKDDGKKEGSEGRERFMRGSGIEEFSYECWRCVLVNVSVRLHVQRECMRDLTIRKTVEKKREYKKTSVASKPPKEEKKTEGQLKKKKHQKG